MAELFYVIGASGVGKDSLLRYARTHTRTDAGVVFAHRYITREADAGGENHVSLTPDEFACRLEKGCFAMHWHSHDTWYGIGIEIEQWMAQGLSVVVNGSRAYLNNAAALYPELRPVLIMASQTQLRQRLQVRGRESETQIEERLSLAQRLDGETSHPRLMRIRNDATLEEAGAALTSVLEAR
jgi:ribose 1,5-bisphosphokinase